MQPVEHEIHRRRLSRNVGLGLVLFALVAVIFGLTMAKIDDGGRVEGYDHVAQPEVSQ